MKTIQKIMTVLAVAATALSCTNGEVSETIQQPAEGGLLKFTLEVTDSGVQLADNASRVEYRDGNGVEWVTGEDIGLVSADGQRVKSGGAYDITDDNKFNPKFTVKAAEGEYMAYHPYNDASSWNNIVFDVAAEQEQRNASLMDIMDSKRLSMVGNGTVSLTKVGDGTDALNDIQQIKFKVVGSVLRFRIYGGEEGEVLRSVTVSSDADLCGKMTLDNSGAVTGASDTGKNVKLHIGSGVSVSDASGIYMSVLPCESATNVVYTVKTNKKSYTFNAAQTKTWANSTLYDIKLNLAKASSSVEADAVPERLFIYGSATTAGWDQHNAIAMTREGNKFSVSTILLGDKENGEWTRSFRFSANRSISPNDLYVKGNDDSSFVYGGSEQSKNFDFAVGTGYFTVTVDFDTHKISLERESPWLFGNFTNWRFDNGNQQLQPKAGVDNVYCMTYTVPKQENWSKGFKFATKRYSYDYVYYSPSSETLEYQDYYRGSQAINRQGSEPDTKWGLGAHETGYEYYIELDMRDGNNVQLTMYPTKFYLTGVNGAWNILNENYLLAPTDETYIKFQWTGNVTSTGSFKIHGANTGNWGNNNGMWIYAGEAGSSHVTLESGVAVDVYPYADGDIQWNFPELGNYTVTLDLSAYPAIKLTAVRNGDITAASEE